jgi:hypothetical protein
MMAKATAGHVHGDECQGDRGKRPERHIVATTVSPNLTATQ